MKVINIVFIAASISIFVSCISINKMPKYLDDDGTSFLTPQLKERIHEYDTYFKYHPIPDTVKYHFETLNSENIKDLAKKSKYSWFIIHAPWCPHSGVIVLRNSRRFKMNLDSLYNLKLYSVSQSYDLDNVQKLLQKNNNVKANTYILDSREFGTNEELKMTNLCNKLFGPKQEWSSASPQSFVVDQNMNLVIYKRGDKTNLDTVLKYIKIYEQNIATK